MHALFKDFAINLEKRLELPISVPCAPNVEKIIQIITIVNQN